MLNPLLFAQRLKSFPRRLVERLVVYAANVRNKTYLDIGPFLRLIARLGIAGSRIRRCAVAARVLLFVAASRQNHRQREDHD
ncbi:hypothetical protein D1872_299420 [compost metagenome]